MARSKVGITQSTAPDAYLDSWSVAVGTTNQEREIVVIGGTASDDIAPVSTAAPASNAPGLAVRPIGNASGEVKVTIADTLTVGSHAVTNAGTFAVQVNGDALTALQAIDNPVKVDDAGFTMATDSVMMAGFVFDDTTPDSVDEGDAGAARMSANRNQYMQIRDGATGAERGAAVNASGELAVKVADSLTVGTVTAVTAITNALPAGTNNIGDVDILTIAAGDNNIGNVDIVTVPADPFGANADAAVAAGAAGSIQAKLRSISRDLVANVVLAAGTNNIGDVDIASIAAGDNNIGNVDIASAIPAGTNKIGAVDLDSDATPGAAVPSVAQLVAGSDGTNARSLKTDASGELQVDIIGALPAGTAAIGKLAANDGVDIGDVTINNSTVPIDGRVTAELEGSLLRYQGSTATVAYAPFTATASGTVTLISSATGRIVVLGYTLVTNSAFALQFKDSTDSTLSGIMPFAANGGNVNAANPHGVFKTASGTALTLVGATATGITGGHITYVRVP